MEYLKFNKQYYCGVDLHAKSIYVCLMNYNGKVFIHRKVPSDPLMFMNTIEAFKDNLVVGAESTFNWYWIADVCRENNIEFALGNALYMKAIHGGKKKNDKIDSKTIAELLRSGMFPPSYPYRKEKRAVRDLLRRRHKLVMDRAGFYRHIKMLYYQQGLTPPTLLDIKKPLNENAIVSFFNEPGLRLTLSANFKMINTLNTIIRPLEKEILAITRDDNRKDFNILMSILGLGEISAINVLYEIDTIDRFPTHQKFSSYCRVVKGKHESAGKKYPSKNQKIGNPYLKWTMSEIAVHAIEFSKEISAYYKKLSKKCSKGKAKSILAHKFAVAIYYMLKNQTVFDIKKFIN